MTGSTWAANTQINIPYMLEVLRSEIWVYSDASTGIKLDGYLDSVQNGRLVISNKGASNAVLMFQYGSAYANMSFSGIIEFIKNE